VWSNSEKSPLRKSKKKGKVKKKTGRNRKKGIVHEPQGQPGWQLNQRCNGRRKIVGQVERGNKKQENVNQLMTTGEKVYLMQNKCGGRETNGERR